MKVGYSAECTTTKIKREERTMEMKWTSKLKLL